MSDYVQYFQQRNRIEGNQKTDDHDRENHFPALELDHSQGKYIPASTSITSTLNATMVETYAFGPMVRHLPQWNQRGRRPTAREVESAA